MTKETPVAQAHIDLMHIAMKQVSQHTTQLEIIGRITEEQHTEIAEALDSLGEKIAKALHHRKKKVVKASPEKMTDLNALKNVDRTDAEGEP